MVHMAVRVGFFALALASAQELRLPALPGAASLNSTLKLPAPLEDAPIREPGLGSDGMMKPLAFRSFRMRGNGPISVQVFLLPLSPQAHRAKLDELHRELDRIREDAMRQARPQERERLLEEMAETDLSLRLPDGRRGYLGGIPGQDGSGAITAQFETPDRRQEVIIVLIYGFADKRQASEPVWREVLGKKSALDQVRRMAIAYDRAMSDEAGGGSPR